jgi:predicted transcriptional regulator
MEDYFYTAVYHSIMQYTMEQSTIKLSKKLKNDLKKQMNHPNETYEMVIARLLKITQEGEVLSNEAIRNIEEGIADIKAGRVYTSKQVKRKLGLK